MRLFESQLRDLNPGVVQLQYDINDLMRFIDALPDLSILVLDLMTKNYVPYGKQYIKTAVSQYLLDGLHTRGR